MAKANKDKDRRAVVEEMRREQKRSERKRSLVIIGSFVTVGLVIVAMGAYPVVKDALKQDELGGQKLASLGVTASAANCTEVEAKKAVGAADHRTEGEPLSYPDSPPATGPHYPVSAPMSRKFYTVKERPDLGYLVHNLEHGYSILWYDETIAKDDDALAEVKAIAEKFAGTDMEKKFIAAPWTAEDGEPFPDGAHLAITHWSMGGTNDNPKGQHGVTQYCEKPSGDAVASFVEDYPYADSPEPGAA